MSNKPKGVAIHPNNNISPVDVSYKAFVRHAIDWARKGFHFSKHVGSKPPHVLKLYKD